MGINVVAEVNQRRTPRENRSHNKNGETKKTGAKPGAEGSLGLHDGKGERGRAFRSLLQGGEGKIKKRSRSPRGQP